MTHCQRVLDLLSDGEPHDHHSLYALNVIAHSRVSDLRKRGHTIEMWREDDAYWYRLLSDRHVTPSAVPIAEQTSAAGRRPPPLGGSSTELKVDRVDEGPQPPSTPAAVQTALDFAEFYVRNYGEPRAA